VRRATARGRASLAGRTRLASRRRGRDQATPIDAGFSVRTLSVGGARVEGVAGRVGRKVAVAARTDQRERQYERQEPAPSTQEGLPGQSHGQPQRPGQAGSQEPTKPPRPEQQLPVQHRVNALQKPPLGEHAHALPTGAWHAPSGWQQGPLSGQAVASPALQATQAPPSTSHTGVAAGHCATSNCPQLPPKQTPCRSVWLAGSHCCPQPASSFG
jgi:hypothetical protein